MFAIALLASLGPNSVSAGSAKSKQFNTKIGKSTTKPPHLEAPSKWKKLLNPREVEFWEENNGYLPDKGWLLYLQNPTDENARYWLLRGEIKAVEMNRIQAHLARVELELIKEGKLEDRYGKLKARPSLAQIETAAKNADGLNYYFLFSPQCKACSKQAGVLKNFKNVFPLQASGKALKHYPGLKVSKWADKKVKDDYLKEGVTPVTILHDPKNKTIHIARGFTDFKTLLLLSGRLQKGRKK